MALTQIKTDAISDDAVTLAKQAAGTDGQIITYDASGNPTAVGPGTDGQVLTSTGAGSPPAFETPAPGVGGATGVDFNDNVKVRWGTGNDLEMYYSGSDGFIKQPVGAMWTESSSWIITSANGGETMARFTENGSCDLYYNNVKKLETTSNGITVTGLLEVDGNVTFDNATNAGKDINWNEGENKLKFEDSVYAKFGSGNDLSIYHDGSDSYIEDSGTGHLKIDGSRVILRNVANDDPMVDCTGGGVVEIYHNGSKKLETTSTGVNVTGGVRIGGNNAANELDDYEEGTFTPQWYGDSNAGTVSYGSQNAASYTKIGNYVTVRGYTDIDQMVNSTGGIMMGNLPFVSVNNLGSICTGSCMTNNLNTNNSSTPITYKNNNSDNMAIYNSRDSDSWYHVPSMDSWSIIWELSYQAA